MHAWIYWKEIYWKELEIENMANPTVNVRTPVSFAVKIVTPGLTRIIFIGHCWPHCRASGHGRGPRGEPECVREFLCTRVLQRGRER